MLSYVIFISASIDCEDMKDRPYLISILYPAKHMKVFYKYLLNKQVKINHKEKYLYFFIPEALLVCNLEV